METIEELRERIDLLQVENLRLRQRLAQDVALKYRQPQQRAPGDVLVDRLTYDNMCLSRKLEQCQQTLHERIVQTVDMNCAYQVSFALWQFEQLLTMRKLTVNDLCPQLKNRYDSLVEQNRLNHKQYRLERYNSVMQTK